MLTITQVVEALSKVAATAGNLPVKLKAVEGDAETFLHSIEVEFGFDGTTASTSATITHTTQAPAEPAAEPDPEGTNAATDQAASHVPDGTQG